MKRFRACIGKSVEKDRAVLKSRIPGIFENRLFSSGSRFAGCRIALPLLLRFSVIFEYGGLIP